MLIANIAAITLFFVLAIAVLAKRKLLNVDYFLMATILIFATYLISDIWVNLSLNHWSFFFHSIVSFLSFLPFFFYAVLLISKKHRIKRSWWWFMSLHILYFLFVTTDIFLFNDYSLEDIQGLYVDPPLTYLLFYKVLHIYIIITMFWFLTKLRAYQQNLLNYYSNIDEVKLDWLKYFSWIYIASYGTSFLTNLAFNFGWIKDIKIPYLLISISILLSLIWMIYHGLRQYTLANFSEPEVSDSKIKYSSSSLTEQLAKDLFGRIIEKFEKDEIFLNPNLKVQDISSSIGVTNHNVSQVLNQVAKSSFYDFVNNYRLQYFKKLLADPGKKRFTILALGMDSGFNSKASLNRVFKQQLGITPKQYQQSLETSQVSIPD